MGKKAVAKLCGCHDLQTADGESQTNSESLCQIKSRSLHKRKPTLLKHAFIEIVNITKVHRLT